jgi:hypothetical protein
MRLSGLVLLVGGVAAFFYCSSRLSGLGPIPDGIPIGDYFNYEAGKWEMGRIGAAVAALVGVLLSMFPKGR